MKQQIAWNHTLKFTPEKDGVAIIENKNTTNKEEIIGIKDGIQGRQPSHGSQVKSDERNKETGEKESKEENSEIVIDDHVRTIEDSKPKRNQAKHQ